MEALRRSFSDMGGTSNATEDGTRSDGSPGGASATLKLTIIAALATIIGASIGTAGTLAVSNQQIDSQQQSAQKDRLRVTCTDFLKASDAAIEAVGHYRSVVQEPYRQHPLTRDPKLMVDPNAKAVALERVEHTRDALTTALYPLTLVASKETGRKALEIQVTITEGQDHASRAVILSVLGPDRAIASLTSSFRSLVTARRFHAELLDLCQKETSI
jgi:hypothetical protein